MSVMPCCRLISFSLPKGRLVKTEGCQKDLVMAIMLKKNLHVKYLICFIWQGMLLPLGNKLNKQGLLNGDITENMNYGGTKYLFFCLKHTPEQCLANMLI